ncbi:hypothetical protein MC885_019017, partial [Smutsia gigantea]
MYLRDFGIASVGKELYEKKDAEMDPIFADTESYLKTLTLVLMLQAQIQKLKKDCCQEQYILRPYLAFDSILCEALQYSLPPFIPPSHTEESGYPMPRVIFRMFDYTDGPQGSVMPGSHSVERFVIENLHCIISPIGRKGKLCTDGKNKIPLSYHMVEMIFAELFQLPTPPHIGVMYTSLLIELCELQPHSLLQVLAQATEILYMCLDKMNTCIKRIYVLQTIPAFVSLDIKRSFYRLPHLAAKSFSHSFSALAKFHSIFKTLAESDGLNLHILIVMFEVCRHHPQMMAVLVDNMIPTQVVDCSTVIIWEILHSTIHKMNKHVLKILRELEEAKTNKQTCKAIQMAKETPVGLLTASPNNTAAHGTLENLPFIVESDPHILAVFRQF